MRITNKTMQLLGLVLAAGSCLTLALSFLTADGSAAPPVVQEMRGVFDGFDVRAGEPPDPSRTEITGQQNRRFTGFAEPPDPNHPAIAIEGTVSASGNVNYQGRAPGNHTVGKSKLHDFGGGAAILNGRETRHVNGQTFIVPCVLVMRAFAGDGSVVPNPAGRYVGTLNGGDGVTGQIDMRLSEPPDPNRPQSFNGTMEVVIGGETHAFLLRGTINGSRRIIAIAATTEGHMIFDAILAEPPDPGMPATLNGGFTLELHDGSEFEGLFATEKVRAIS